MMTVAVDEQDEYDPLSIAPLEGCQTDGRCRAKGRVVVKRSFPYEERKLCARHARVHIRNGWTFVGTLSRIRFDPWV